MQTITTLFLDIGGVLLTNGWDAPLRKKAAETFGLEFRELNARHRRAFPAFEKGKIGLDDYLERVVFTKARLFSPIDFREFMVSQTRELPGMRDLVRNLKARHGLKVVAVSNEGRELTEYRIRTFELGNVIDFFVASCFVHLRKPDARIFRLALDLAHAAPEQVVYLDDRPGNIKAAGSLGIHAIRHRDCDSTRREIEAHGLPLAA